MTNTSVLVLENHPQTLAVVRSLGAAGYHVVLGHQKRRSEASYSRFCGETWTHPPLSDTAGFSTSLRQLLDSRPDIRWIFPVAERSVKLILRLSDSLREDIQIAMASPKLFFACLDKLQANRLSVAAQVPTPRTEVVSTLEDLQKAAQMIGYPVILKAVDGSQRVFGRKAYVIEGPEQLDTLFREWPQEHNNLMIQEFIDGTLEASDFVAQNGTLVAYCEAHSERTDLLDGTGLGVEFKSIPPSPDVFAATCAFVKTHGYTGPGLIQFVRAKETGEIYFLENNPRLSAGVADTIAFGQDLPLITLQAIDSETRHDLQEFSTQGNPYHYDHYAYWFSRDLSGYLNHRANLSKEERREWVTSILRSIRRADSHIMWQMRDPIPGITLLTRMSLNFIGKKIFRKAS